MLEKLNDKTREEVRKFAIYADFSAIVSRLKPYQTLALNRGENLEILNIKIEKDDASYDLIKHHFSHGSLIAELEEAVSKGYTALFKSVETELRNGLTEKAEDESIRTFQANLSNLLMTKPEYGKKILGIDPGYRTGCKIVILDELGNPLEFSKIFIHEEAKALEILKTLHAKYQP